MTKRINAEIPVSAVFDLASLLETKNILQE
jgi:hypothetical protein